MTGCTCATFKKAGVTFTQLRDPECPVHGNAPATAMTHDGYRWTGEKAEPEDLQAVIAGLLDAHGYMPVLAAMGDECSKRYELSDLLAYMFGKTPRR